MPRSTPEYIMYLPRDRCHQRRLGPERAKTGLRLFKRAPACRSRCSANHPRKTDYTNVVYQKKYHYVSMVQRDDIDPSILHTALLSIEISRSVILLCSALTRRHSTALPGQPTPTCGGGGGGGETKSPSASFPTKRATVYSLPPRPCTGSTGLTG